MNDQNKSRIAIRFGGSSASKGPSGPKGTPRPTPSSTLGKRHRPRFNDDGDSDANDGDGDNEGDEQTQHESITHFGANGAEFVDEERTRGDRERAEDRRAASKRTNSPAEKPVRMEKDEVDDEEPLKYGLTIAKKPQREEIMGEDKQREKDALRQPKTEDEEALDALLGKDTGKQRPLHRTEDDAYRDAAAGAPEVDDLATYDAIPVEGFGASLLKGQGWDGKMRGPKAKEITRRPIGMGLGAKKLKAEEDLGAWDSKGKSKSDKRPRLDEYRREKEKEKSRREDRHRDRHRNERERDRHRDRDDGDGDGDRDRDSYRHRDNRDRDHRR